MTSDFTVHMDEYLPLREVVFNTLRQAILKGELKPGERLMEIALAEKLGVSRAEHYKEIKAGNDVKMGTGFPERVKKAMEMGQLGRPELEHCARRVLELILKID